MACSASERAGDDARVSEEIMAASFRTALVALAGACLVAPRGAAVAQAVRPTVAIMYFNNNVITKDARDYDGLSKGLPDFLITEMSSNAAIRVVERDQVQKLLDEQKLVGAGQVDRESAVRVGKLLGAQHMIFGGFMADAKGNFRIDARAVNVETGALEFTDRVQDRSENVLGLIGQLASRLNADSSSPPRPRASATRVLRPVRSRPARRPRRSSRCAPPCCTARRSTWPTGVTMPARSSCSARY
jgi:TolB-like protein